MMKNKYILSLIMTIFMFGCTATPDLSNWSKTSEDIRDSMVKSQSDIKSNLSQLVSISKLAQNEGWDSTCATTTFNPAVHVNWQTAQQDWTRNQKLYATASADVELGLNAMVLYAQAVNELAASSGTGEEAAEGIVKSIKSIGSLLGAAIPRIDTTGKVFKLISEKWTNIKAQDSLAETMTVMQSNVDTLATALKNQTSVQISVIDKMFDMSKAAIQGRYGNERMCFYQRVENRLYKEVEEPFRVFNIEWDNKDDAQKKATKTVIASNLIIDQFGVPIYHKYLEEIRVLKAWETKNKQQAKMIGEAATVWASIHNTVANEMASCGGLRSLYSHCGNWTLENIKIVRDRLKSLSDSADNE
tara:strand:+ start:177 stop:1253 length:1077 start_codon:yes stop_codon:yes gene_type:complete